MTAPHIIRTVAELDALDSDTALILSSSMRSADWEETNDNDLPAVVIATAEWCREAAAVLLDVADEVDRKNKETTEEVGTDGQEN